MLAEPNQQRFWLELTAVAAQVDITARRLARCRNIPSYAHSRARHVPAYRFAALHLLAGVVFTLHLPGVFDQIVFERARDGVAVLRFYAVVPSVVSACANRNQ